MLGWGYGCVTYSSGCGGKVGKIVDCGEVEVEGIVGRSRGWMDGMGLLFGVVTSSVQQE